MLSIYKKVSGIISNGFSVIVCLVLSFSCTADKKCLITDGVTGRISLPVMVINNGLHTGIVLERKDAEQSVGVLKNFSKFSYADFGWGDEDYYQHHGPACILGAKALFLPTSSVMRVEGFSESLEDVANWSDFTVQFTVSLKAYSLLCEYIDDSFSKDQAGECIQLSEKGRGNVIFYESDFCYHIFKTCNTWVADALNSAGYGFSTCFLITADDLYEEIKDCGKVLKGT